MAMYIWKVAILETVDRAKSNANHETGLVKNPDISSVTSEQGAGLR